MFEVGDKLVFKSFPEIRESQHGERDGYYGIGERNIKEHISKTLTVAGVNKSNPTLSIIFKEVGFAWPSCWFVKKKGQLEFLF